MNFEVTYDQDTEETTIIFDDSITLRAVNDEDGVTFQHFEKIDDEDIELMLKNLCRQIYRITQ